MFDPCRSSAVRPSSEDVLTVVDVSMQGRLNLALGDVARPVHLGSVSEAISVASTRPVRAVLVSPSAVGAEWLPAVGRFTNTWGGLLIAVTGGWTPGLSETLLAFGRYGIREAVDMNMRDGLSRLRLLLAQPEWELSNRIAETLQPSLAMASDEMRFFVGHLVRAAPVTASIRGMAEELGIYPSSLMSRFFRARLPSPKQYLAAMRLLYATAVLENPRMSVSQAARRLNYSSPQHFGRHVQQQLGVTAIEFRQQYSFAAMADRFADLLLLRHKEALRWFEPIGRGVNGYGHGSH